MTPLAQFQGRGRRGSVPGPSPGLQPRAWENCQPYWALLFPARLPVTVTRLHYSISCSGVPPKAFLLLKPPWTTAFENEKVTIVCDSPLPPVPGNVTWYYTQSYTTKGSKETTLKGLEEIQVTKSGFYRCETSGSSLSDPVHVELSSGKRKVASLECRKSAWPQRSRAWGLGRWRRHAWGRSGLTPVGQRKGRTALSLFSCKRGVCDPEVTQQKWTQV